MQPKYPHITVCQQAARKAVLIGIAFVLPVLTAVAGDEKAVEYGKYICVTDRAVGFQTPENSTARYAGQIQMSPEKQKFFATIVKIETVPMNGTGDWIKEGVIQHVPERCFSAENIAKLEKQWRDGGISFLAPNTEDFFKWCLARSAVTLKADKISYPYTDTYYSLGKNVFLDDLGNKFWMWNGWNFRWTFTNLGGEAYMMEGRCDLVQ